MASDDPSQPRERANGVHGPVSAGQDGEQGAAERIFGVAQKMARGNLSEFGLPAAIVVLRAALGLARDGFDPAGLDDEDLEAHILDAARLLLRKEAAAGESQGSNNPSPDCPSGPAGESGLT